MGTEEILPERTERLLFMNEPRQRLRQSMKQMRKPTILCCASNTRHALPQQTEGKDYSNWLTSGKPNRLPAPCNPGHVRQWLRVA